MVRFSDAETEQAIAVLTAVINASGKPMPVPEIVRVFDEHAATGDSRAQAASLAARLRMIYPVVPKQPFRSPYEKLWGTIMSGRYEGILIARHLDYAQAWIDTAGGTKHAAPGSAFDRWLTLAVKQELANALAEGQGDFKWI
ncbi:MAG: hypothetical protein IJ120_00795 [Solobacterium sp.]|nr:hypothetical protein [Solobacterium sp.]